jgi:predicted Zn-dependent protease
LKHRLEFSPFEPATGEKLTRLVLCKVDKKCNLENQTLLDFINAALRNPTTIGDRRGQVLSSLTYYLVDLAGDYPQALDVMRQMVQSNPQQIEPRLTLAKFLMAMQKPAEARQELAEIKKIDRLNAYTLEIAQIEQQLGSK